MPPGAGDDTSDDMSDDWFDDDDLDGGGDGEGTVPFEYRATVAPDSPDMADLLRRGDVEVLGMMPWSSNGTFLVQVTDGDRHAPAIYKPEQGERPLWDFPGGLWKREVAACELSEALGFGLVPPTVARDDAPLGIGSVQAFVPARFAEHYFTLKDDESLAPVFRRLCAFDLVANSADRKAGHCLIDDADRIWAIDNGLTFHAEFKVRTVIWDFAGEPVPADVAEALSALLDAGLPDPLAELLDPFERDAVLTRAGAVLASARFPHDPSGRRYPWPLV